MLTCEHCGAALRDEWDYCGRCGTDRLPPADAARPRREAATAAAGVGVLRARAVLHGAGAVLGGVPGRLRSSSIAERARPLARLSPAELRRAWHPAVLSLLAVAAFAVLSAWAWQSGAQARSAADDAQTAAAQAQAENARLAADLERAEAQHQVERQAASEEIAALEERLSGDAETAVQLQEEVDALSGDLDEALADLDGANAEIEELNDRIAGQATAISTLSECLSGMQVALAFARSGQQDASARAYIAVSDVCDRARELLP